MTKVNREDISVELLDFMGSDEDIESAARISFNADTEERTPEQTERLIRYLMWWRHTSPFEMAEVKFKITVPMYIGEQILRHRTASVNKISRRYTNDDISFYDFELREADNSSTKQGSGKVFDREINGFLYKLVEETEEKQQHVYEELIRHDVANEVARGVLGADLMTTFVWKIDLHNLMHFLNLRLHPHAQKEIRIVAGYIYDIVKELFPITIKAFDDWRELNMSFMKTFYPMFKYGKTDDGLMELDDIAQRGFYND